MADIFRCGGRPLALVLLAGGGSRRMGRNKALLPVGGETLIELILKQLEDYFAETLVSVGRPGPFAFLKRTLVPDQNPGEGPMMGLYTAMSRSAYKKYFVTACDIPQIDIGFVRRLVDLAEEYAIVLPTRDGTTPEPLFGVYDRGVLPLMKDLLMARERSLLPLLVSSRTKLVPLEGSWYRNLNTLTDYKDFLDSLRS